MTSRPSRLRAVGPDDVPAPKKVHARIADALGGSSRDVLASMRLTLAKKIDAGDVASNALASAYKELRELDRLIRLEDAESEEAVGHGVLEDENFDASAI